MTRPLSEDETLCSVMPPPDLILEPEAVTAASDPHFSDSCAQPLSPRQRTPPRPLSPSAQGVRKHGRPPERDGTRKRLVVSQSTVEFADTESQFVLPTTPAAAAPDRVLLTLVLVTEFDGRLKALVALNHTCLVGSSRLHEHSRSSMVVIADSWARQALGHNNLAALPASFLAADFGINSANSRTVVVVRPIFDTPRAMLLALAVANACKWISRNDAPSGATSIVAAAMLAVASHRQRSQTPCPLRFSSGARPAFSLQHQTPATKASVAAWAGKVQQMKQLNADLARELLAVRGADEAYCRSWFDRIIPFDGEEIPQSLRGAALKRLPDTIAWELFSPVYMEPQTTAQPPPAAFVSTFKPSSLTDIIRPDAIAKMSSWLEELAIDLAAMHDNPQHKRRLKRTLVITQSDVYAEARGVVWDLRTRHFESALDLVGHFRPLDVHGGITTHLNTKWLRDTLGPGFRDAELLDYLENGMRFKANLPLAAVLCPHLTSLPKGFPRVEKEIRRLIDLEWYQISKFLPFFPVRALPQGCVERKLENRPRRTSDGGNPRVPFVENDVLIQSINAAIDIKGSIHVGNSGEPTVKQRKWVPEVKPTLRKVMRNATILRQAGQVWGLSVVAFTDDCKDFFMQLRLHPSELWKACHIWRSLSADHPLLSWVAELVLGFGISVSSNVAQRFAHAIVSVVYEKFDKQEEAFLEAERDPKRRAWIDLRRHLSKVSGREQMRLFAIDMYTDDPIFMAVGPQRAVRLIRCWGEVTSSLKVLMAIAKKRQIGSSIEWIGARLHVALGIAVIPEQKRLRAIEHVTRLAEGAQSTFGDYRQLVGLLQHLVTICGRSQRAMYSIYWPHRRNLGPGDMVFLGESTVAKLQEWTVTLAFTSGTAFDFVLTGKPPPKGACSTFALYQDACKEGAADPGLGGFFHGYWWRVSLDDVGIRHWPIPQLELAAIGVGFIIAFPFVQAASATIYSDSLTSTDVISGDSAQSELMQLIHAEITNLSEYKAMAPHLTGAHIYGEANPLSDFASRDKIVELESLCAALGIRARQLPVPQEALDFLSRLSALDRSLTAVEQALGTTVPNTEAGDAVISPYKASICFNPMLRKPRKGGLGSYRSVVPSHAQLAHCLTRCSVEKPTSLVTAPLIRDINKHPITLFRCNPPREWGQIPMFSPRMPGVTTSVLRISPPHEEPSRQTPKRARKHLAYIQEGRVAQLIAELEEDDSPFAVRPSNPAVLQILAEQIGDFIHRSVPENSSGGLCSAWRSWVACALRLGFAPWRRDPTALEGGPAFRREVFIMCAALLDMYAHMKPRRKSDPAPKPASVLAILSSVRRIHRLEGVPMVSSKQISDCLEGMLNDFIHKHGPEALLPARKEPLSNSLFLVLLNTLNGVNLNRSLKVDWTSNLFIGAKAAMCTAKQAGLRKAECALKTATSFNMTSASRANLQWNIKGTLHSDPSADLLNSLQRGDWAVLIPPTSKADQKGMVWGNLPIHLPYVDRVTNAAKALRDMEIAMPVRGTDARRNTFLFTVSSSYEPLIASRIDSILAALLKLHLRPDVAATYSFHSFRIALACELRARGASDAQIQALCRWQSLESLHIYSRMNPSDYIHWILKASEAQATSIMSKNLPTIDADTDMVNALPLIRALAETQD